MNVDFVRNSHPIVEYRAFPNEMQHMLWSNEMHSFMSAKSSSIS